MLGSFGARVLLLLLALESLTFSVLPAAPLSHRSTRKMTGPEPWPCSQQVSEDALQPDGRSEPQISRASRAEQGSLFALAAPRHGTAQDLCSGDVSTLALAGPSERSGLKIRRILRMESDDPPRPGSAGI